MYKKIVGGLILSFFALISITKADIQSVSFSYCDGSPAGNTIVINPQKDQDKEICLRFVSGSPIPSRLNYGFSIGVAKQGAQLCDADMSSTNSFAKFFVSSGERSIILSGSKPQDVIEKIRIPVGMKGIQYGCISYALAETVEAGGMFNVVVRKAVPLNIFIEGDSTIKNNLTLLENIGGAYSTNKQVKMEVDKNNKATLIFLVKNDGNIEQQVIITGSVYNIFGFEKTFSNPAVNIRPGETNEISIAIGVIPFYKSFFTIEFNVQNTPVFSFDASNLDEKLTKGGVQNQTATIFVFSWIAIAVLVIVVYILLKKVIFKKRKEAQIITPVVAVPTAPVMPVVPPTSTNQA